ncbi:MAG: hypothetical protein EP343_34725 [Deltaproteobacteria bacterium]|nr:MAG: hypothetical protein EP343_34725 [Deltaproteobacteria bacterium]
MSHVGAKNIIEWCSSLNLCDNRGHLQKLGEDTAETDEAPVPEQGVFEVWAAQHPLFGSRWLHVERITSQTDHRFEHLESLPLYPDIGNSWQSVIDPTKRYVLRGLPSQSMEVQCFRGVTNSSCRIRWSFDFTEGTNQWQMEGALDPERKLRAIQHNPESVPLDLWKLFERWASWHLAEKGQWNTEQHYMAVSFAELTEDAQETFVQNFSILELEVPGYGSYANVEFQNVPIGPNSESDASQWAVARLTRRIKEDRRYRTRNDVRRYFVELVEGTPLELFQPSLPSHTELLDEFSGLGEMFWSLAAPVDLAPFVPGAQELASLTIGSNSQLSYEGQNREEAIVRIPHRGEWSMHDLVARLLNGAKPYRVLLCDRYIRGGDNLATLQLLFDTIKKLHSTARLEIVTEPEGKKGGNLSSIEKIIGSSPRTYHDMFGSNRNNRPHARYFLIDEGNGEGVCWQMDNSPLDSRPNNSNQVSPRTPLRWRDFGAFQLDKSELPLDLGRWFEGGA